MHAYTHAHDPPTYTHHHPSPPLPTTRAQVNECRAMLALPDANTMVAGDRSGAVKIFQWRAPVAAAAGLAALPAQ